MLTNIRIRPSIFWAPKYHAPDSANSGVGRPKNTSAKNMGAALRAAMVSIGVLGGAGIGRSIRGRTR